MIPANRVCDRRGRADVAASYLEEGAGLHAIEHDGQKLRGTSGIRKPLIQGVSSRRTDGWKFPTVLRKANSLIPDSGP